jgi:hypothetical protein
MLKRVAPILLVIAFVALGSGMMAYLHNLQHAAEDAREDAVARASDKPVEQHHHDESNCEVHAQLILAFFFDGWAMLFAFLNLLVAVLVLTQIEQIRQATLLRVSCRGPPLFCTSL